jgi:hypothetical protein
MALKVILVQVDLLAYKAPLVLEEPQDTQVKKAKRV